MGRQGKYWLIGAIGFILIVLLGFAAAGDARNRNGIDSTDGTKAGEALEDYLKEQDTIMEEMMEDMEDIPETGNASIDFLNGMIPHHESAIDMAESYLKYGGTNEDLKKIADDVIKVQKGEIDQMKELIEKIEDSGARDEEKAGQYRKEYAGMFSSHGHMHSNASNVEQAFAEGMIMHHQMAVDMAEAILKYTEEEEVKELSQAIIEAQRKEIEEMRQIEKEARQ